MSEIDWETCAKETALRGANQAAELGEVKADNAELRDALEQIAKRESWEFGCRITDLDQAVRLADEALRRKVSGA